MSIMGGGDEWILEDADIIVIQEFMYWRVMCIVMSVCFVDVHPSLVSGGFLLGIVFFVWVVILSGGTLQYSPAVLVMGLLGILSLVFKSRPELGKPLKTR